VRVPFGLSRAGPRFATLMTKFLAATSASWRAALLAVLAAFVWIAHFDRWSIESWRVPTDYLGDAPEALARLKAASEGDMLPMHSQVISRLGAPFGAHWNAYPSPDKPLMLILGGLVHAVGLHAAANLGLLLAQVTAALAFYGVARWLRFRWEWAAAGALLFAYTYHTFHRGLAHFSLVFTWTVPLGLAAVWLISGSRRIAWRRPAAMVSLFAGIALGTSNPYNLFFWLQLMGWAIVWQWFGPRRKQNLTLGLTSIGLAVLAFAVTNSEMWLHVDNPDAQPLLARNYGGTEIYALKPVEMFIPPTFHHWDFLAFFGNRYTRWSPWRGEVFLPYLGLVGIAGFAWLGWVTIRRIVAKRALPGQAVAIGWIMSYATIGGLTNVVALFAGIQVFRATNRAAIFISAIVLFFLIGRLSRLSSRWPAWARLGAAAAITIVGLFDQLPKLEPELEVKTIAAEVQSDEEFGRALEQMLPAQAMLFQLPVIGFPEVQAPHRLGEYEHFRPYLSTDNLRFSFGAAKFRSRSRWQREIEGLPTAELVPRLERHGFAAVYLNRKGFEDRGEKVLRELAAMGYTRRLDARGGNQVAILLQPSPTPAPPLALALTYGRGWHPRSESGWRWAFDDAALSYFNPYNRPITVNLEFKIVGIGGREITFENNRKIVRRFETTDTATAVLISDLELTPGVNRFRLCSNRPAVRQNAGRNQLRSYGLEESTVRVVLKRIAPTQPTIARIGDL
jgi:hypothetical protein